MKSVASEANQYSVMEGKEDSSGRSPRLAMVKETGSCCGRKGRDHTYMSILSGILTGFISYLLVVHGTAMEKKKVQSVHSIKRTDILLF